MAPLGSRPVRWGGFIAGIAIAGLVTGCGEACQNEITGFAISPSGELEAIVFHRDCGAATGINTHVSIIDAKDDLPDRPGNVAIVNGKVPLKARWTGHSQLEISQWGSGGIVKKETRVGQVTIRYAP